MKLTIREARKPKMPEQKPIRETMYITKGTITQYVIDKFLNGTDVNGCYKGNNRDIKLYEETFPNDDVVKIPKEEVFARVKQSFLNNYSDDDLDKYCDEFFNEGIDYAIQGTRDGFDKVLDRPKLAEYTIQLSTLFAKEYRDYAKTKLNLPVAESTRYCSATRKLAINESLKRYFVQTNAYNFVAFVDDNGKVMPVFSFDDKNGKEWDELSMTLNAAKNGDFSGIEGCNDVYEACCDVCIDPSNIFDFSELEDDEYDMYNNPEGNKIIEF